MIEFLRVYTELVYQYNLFQYNLFISIWERRLDVDPMPNVDIYIRDHLMDAGRFTPSQSNLTVAFDDPLRNIDLSLNGIGLCLDLKASTPSGISEPKQNLLDRVPKLFEVLSFYSAIIFYSV
jgi:hypothetical protein